MATWPANAETNWNTKMLAYLAVEHNTDGTHKAITAPSITTPGDVIANGAFSCTAATPITISGGVVTVTSSYQRADTEATAASDNLDTISGGAAGDFLVLQAHNTDRTVVAKDGTGNLILAGDMSLDSTDDTLMLIYDGTNWRELSRSSNGA